jgi:hypothetical protein
MKTLGLALLVVALAAAPAAAGEGQEAAPADLDQLLSEFGRGASGFGATFLLVHLNDLTTDALFDAPLKYSMRAQARTRTMFYVQGVADDDVELNLDFRVQQQAEHFEARSTNILNFEPGAQVSAGDEIRGIIAIERLFDARGTILVFYGGLRVEFTFPPDVVVKIAG